MQEYISLRSLKENFVGAKFDKALKKILKFNKYCLSQVNIGEFNTAV
jgi:hypothetical protein